MRAIPSSGEILAVVAHYLREELAPQLDAPDKFYTLVAANAVEIVRREIELGGEADAAALGRLRALLSDGAASLGDLDTRLCEAIASGHIAVNDPALRDHLVRTALDEVAIDQPRHASIARMRDVAAG